MTDTIEHFGYPGKLIRTTRTFSEHDKAIMTCLKIIADERPMFGGGAALKLDLLAMRIRALLEGEAEAHDPE